MWAETPTNPTLKIFDIKKIAKIVKEINENIIFVVDNTFFSPYLQVFIAFVYFIMILIEPS